jgi:hypothetical protein
MVKISSANVVYGKYLGLFLALVGNFALLVAKDQFRGFGNFIGLNGGLFFTAGIVSIYSFRLWDIEADGETVVATRFNNRLEFKLSDIRRIDVTPNIIMKNTAPPFVDIIFNKEIEGRTEIRYFPSKSRIDEKLLIEPWKNVYRAWAQESMKKRKARR